jgi:pyruvate/2-oxoglutarate dehydrogenase complex dihydrolipoamide dehydrogenase (E3) component
VEALRAEGVNILEGHKVTRVSGDPGRVTVHAEGPGGETAVEGSHILVALGRRAVLDGLDLDKGGVAHTPAGLTVSETLRSKSNPRVWALGDAAGREQFTHVAGWHASVFIRRAFFKQGSTAASLPVPAVTYTSPEIAQIGLTEAEARKKFGDGVKTSAFPFHDNDRAIAEGRTLGEAKLVLHKGKLVGASIAGDGAGDILQLVSVAMSNGLKLTALTNFISPYPTRAEAVKRAASAYFTPSVFGKPARMLVGLLQRIP